VTAMIVYGIGDDETHKLYSSAHWSDPNDAQG
jgi:hypothetical protein